MKANSLKRKIFDAVDMLTEEASTQVQDKAADGVQMLSLEKIKAFHDHPFHLYEGERLQDMVESIKEHGVLTPVIVQKKGVGMKCFPVTIGRMRRSWRDWKRYRLS